MSVAELVRDRLALDIREVANGIGVDVRTVRRDPELMALSIRIGRRSRRWPVDALTRYINERKPTSTTTADTR